jgi:hypothetical protein
MMAVVKCVYVCTQEQDRFKREWERLREGEEVVVEWAAGDSPATYQ